jgi:hypothetical protein
MNRGTKKVVTGAVMFVVGILMRHSLGIDGIEATIVILGGCALMIVGNKQQRKDKKKLEEVSVYAGDSKDGQADGHGSYRYPDGREYVGNWKDGLPNGEGTVTYPVEKDFPDGRAIIGDWSRIQLHPRGLLLSILR